MYSLPIGCRDSLNYPSMTSMSCSPLVNCPLVAVGCTYNNESITIYSNDDIRFDLAILICIPHATGLYNSHSPVGTRFNLRGMRDSVFLCHARHGNENVDVSHA